MAVQYVGKISSFEGKRLFDILCRLKNFGLGRIVTRTDYLKKYSEPSYFVITKVEPDMSDPTQVIVYKPMLCRLLTLLLTFYSPCVASPARKPTRKA